jgi:hypothetical protein
VYDLRLKVISNIAEIIVKIKAAEIINHNTGTVSTKNIRTSSRIQKISPEEIRRVDRVFYLSNYCIARFL